MALQFGGFPALSFKLPVDETMAAPNGLRGRQFGDGRAGLLACACAVAVVVGGVRGLVPAQR